MFLDSRVGDKRVYTETLNVISYEKVNLYKPAGRGFDSRWFHWNFSVT